ncbi:HAMP domain-containing histidine kinase [Streptomyces yunnanensis]|uniref:histidine kinase n=1 Tax=Streptomyces yunnanensis TaxID=156453 RepID=A0ABY8A3D3_9ACTN|nr:HAMP domain-containing sensor histidine kinase [Streptomyces yunnanensis]WEB38826.1 HAMP domain-containing histidine kinase [Streptomyces yunnanensis]
MDVARLVEHAVRDRMPTLTAAGVFTVLRCAPGPALHGDEHRLAQALDNLLENAAKFTPSGGEVEVGAAADGDTWRIVVADTGIGVPESHREEIFSGFVRAPNAPTGPGTSSPRSPRTTAGCTSSAGCARRPAPARVTP